MIRNTDPHLDFLNFFMFFFRILLSCDKSNANFGDRSLLKNLGHWLGNQQFQFYILLFIHFLIFFSVDLSIQGNVFSEVQKLINDHYILLLILH